MQCQCRRVWLLSPLRQPLRWSWMHQHHHQRPLALLKLAATSVLMLPTHLASMLMKTAKNGIRTIGDSLSDRLHLLIQKQQAHQCLRHQQHSKEYKQWQEPKPLTQHPVRPKKGYQQHHRDQVFLQQLLLSQRRQLKAGNQRHCRDHK